MARANLKEADYLLALSSIRGIGGARARRLILAFGSAEAVFDARYRDLSRLSWLPNDIGRSISQAQVAAMTDRIREDCHRLGIRMIGISDSGYPRKLSECPDAPLVLYYRGSAEPDQDRVLSIVGTRRMSFYGRNAIRHILSGLAPYKPLVVSGLAYGVDITAHEVAMMEGMETLAVLPGGLDQVYPGAHIQAVNRMLNQGGILSEMPPGTIPEREYFPTRNRIIAGIADAVLVVESGSSGGSMITAYLAQGYNREVLAVPGRILDAQSEGTNALIASQVALPVLSGKSLAEALGWNAEEAPQMQLFEALEGDEKRIVELIRQQGELHIDEILVKLSLNPQKLPGYLLSLECKGAVTIKPGDRVCAHS